MTMNQPAKPPCPRRVYIYWRQVERVSPEDAHLHVAEYLLNAYSHEVI